MWHYLMESKFRYRVHKSLIVENKFVPIDVTVIVDIVRRRLDPLWFYLVHYILFREIYALFFIIPMSPVIP